MDRAPRYNTRGSTRRLALALQTYQDPFLAVEYPSETPGEPGRVPVDAEVDILVRQAVSVEQAREGEEDDTEGQELTYGPVPLPPQPLNSSSRVPVSGSAGTSVTALKGGHTGRRRRRRQALAQKATDPREYKIRSSQSVRYREVDHLKTAFDLRNLPAAKGADIGLRRPVASVSPALRTLLRQGFKLVKWKGR